MSHMLNLDVFEGPMDLLLHLIKKNNMDIIDISIAEITREYLAYLEVLQKLNLDSAGEFLVMASTLMQIKARTLLPEPEAEQDEGPDPRADLVAKLLEYQQYKEAAQVLSDKYVVQRNVFYRTEPDFSEDEYVLEASIFDLLGAFKNILTRASDEIKEILYEDIPIESKIREILAQLDQKGYLLFEDMFEGELSKAGLIATFLAMLELIRTKQIVARQARTFSNVRIYRASQKKTDVTDEHKEAVDEPQEKKDEAVWEDSNGKK